MKGTFEHVTRMALREMIQAHSKESKFGFVLSQEGCRDLEDALFEFFSTSRSLKSAGDRFLQTGAPSSTPSPGPLRPGSRVGR